MRATAEFMRDYGLLLATVLLCLTTLWYALATAKMARVMAFEHDLRRRPILSFQPVVVRVKGWNELKIEQHITNIGFSFVTVESAIVSWKRQFDKNFEGTIESDKALPCQLAPGEHLQFQFEIPTSAWTSEHSCAFESAAELIVGRITYRYSGLDARPLIKETSWPGGTIVRVEDPPESQPVAKVAAAGPTPPA
jgi:hypothetical protein